MVSPGTTTGVNWQFINSQLERLAAEKDWPIFSRVLALAIYGYVIFPNYPGVVDLETVSIVHMMENRRVNPIPAILAETFSALDNCHDKKVTSLRCCLPLLYIWALTHICPSHNTPTRMDPHPNPIDQFKRREGRIIKDPSGWDETFQQTTENNICWKLPWWYEEEIMLSCGGFQNLPLPGIRGIVNHNPILTLRQHGFRQVIPSADQVGKIKISYNDSRAMKAISRIQQAWGSRVFRGEKDLGKRMPSASAEYRQWLGNLAKGENPTYAAPVVWDSHRVRDASPEQFEPKEKEPTGLPYSEPEGETVIHDPQERSDKGTKRKDRDYEDQIRRLQEENKKLKSALRDNAKLVKQSEQRAQDSESQLERLAEERDDLKGRLAELEPLREAQEQVRTLSHMLDKGKDEMSLLRRETSDTIQQLLARLNKQGEEIERLKEKHDSQTREAERWRALYDNQHTDNETLMANLQRLRTRTNAAFPDLMEAYDKAEGVANPLTTPFEVQKFFEMWKNLFPRCNR